MKKILFLAINARYVHSNPAVLYLKKNISDLPFDTAVLELSINEAPEKIILAVQHEKPDFLAISVYIWNSLIVKEIIPELKKALPSMRIILGGPDVSYNPDEWLKLLPGIDYIIGGAGEAGFRELALASFECSDRIITVQNPRFSAIPFPYDDNEMKRLAGKFIYYESSRGCPFRCSYCLSSRSDQSLEFRNLEQVESELGFFNAYRPALIKFVDRTFNSRKDHYRGVWEYIVRNFTGGATRFHFEIYPELLDSDDLRFLETVPDGLFQFEMGIQSLKGETLAAINRRRQSEGWMDNIRRLALKGNIHLHVDLIAGLPFESYKDFSGSFNEVYSLDAGHFQCGFLKILPGTEMMERRAEFGLEFSPAPPYQVRSSRWIDPDEMKRLEDIAALVEVYYNSGRFRESVKFLCGMYDTPFRFYDELIPLFRLNNSRLSRWEEAASVLIKIAGIKSSVNMALLIDFLRWDWCCSMKLHHYPELLKSDHTLEAKRRGYNHVIRFSENNRIKFGEIEFGIDELRRSIFFTPETTEFRSSMMKSDYVLFLPDKRAISFNID